MWVLIALCLVSGAPPPLQSFSMELRRGQAEARSAKAGSRANQAAEVVTAIQIHGNLLTPDEEVRRLADVREGMPFEAHTAADITERLSATKKFKSVEVLKRFASIADPSQVLVVIIVDEGAVHMEMTGDASVSP